MGESTRYRVRSYGWEGDYVGLRVGDEKTGFRELCSLTTEYQKHHLVCEMYRYMPSISILRFLYLSYR